MNTKSEPRVCFFARLLVISNSYDVNVWHISEAANAEGAQIAGVDTCANLACMLHAVKQRHECQDVCDINPFKARV